MHRSHHHHRHHGAHHPPHLFDGPPRGPPHHPPHPFDGPPRGPPHHPPHPFDGPPRGPPHHPPHPFDGPPRGPPHHPRRHHHHPFHQGPFPADAPPPDSFPPQYPGTFNSPPIEVIAIAVTENIDGCGSDSVVTEAIPVGTVSPTIVAAVAVEDHPNSTEQHTSSTTAGNVEKLFVVGRFKNGIATHHGKFQFQMPGHFKVGEQREFIEPTGDVIVYEIPVNVEPGDEIHVEY